MWYFQCFRSADFLHEKVAWINVPIMFNNEILTAIIRQAADRIDIIKLFAENYIKVSNRDLV